MKTRVLQVCRRCEYFAGKDEMFKCQIGSKYIEDFNPEEVYEQMVLPRACSSLLEHTILGQDMDLLK